MGGGWVGGSRDRSIGSDRKLYMTRTNKTSASVWGDGGARGGGPSNFFFVFVLSGQSFCAVCSVQSKKNVRFSLAPCTTPSRRKFGRFIVS